MIINKQLFEDVLNGKAKGTFILENGSRVNSDRLRRNDTRLTHLYPYTLKGSPTIYDMYGDFPNGDKQSGQYYKIIDFIPMKVEEVLLDVKLPKGKVIDWEKSAKLDKIVLKDAPYPTTYEDICDRLPGMIDIQLFNTPSKDGNALVANEHYLECILAKNKLATVAKYLNDGWKPIFDSSIFLLKQTSTGVLTFEVANDSCASGCGSIWFKSKDLARQAIKILGEETVKLALEPLGI